jgi:hypothetical protein
MEIRMCDDRSERGFSWIVDAPMTRTSHALAVDGQVWLVDPVRDPPALERAAGLGAPQAVLQLLDRHNRDCAALAARLGVPLVVAPDEILCSPFTFVPIMRWKRWQESALWWPATRTLVCADAFGSNRFYTGGKAPLGVHVLLRLTPPKALGALGPERVLVGHGAGIVGPDTEEVVHEALRTSRRRLPGVLARLPFSGRYSGSQDTSTT